MNTLDFYVEYSKKCDYKQRGITCPNEYAWCYKCDHERRRKLVLFSQCENDPIAAFDQSVAEYYGFDE